MRTFQLRPTTPRPPGFDMTLVIPDAPPAAPPPPCTVEQLWVPLESIATSVAPDPAFSSPTDGYGALYDAGLFTCIDSTNKFGQWLVDTTGILTPMMCAVIVDTADLALNIAFLICNGTNVYIEPGIFSPYFLLQPDAAAQLISFYEFDDAGAEHLATPVTFRIVAFPLSLP